MLNCTEVNPHLYYVPLNSCKNSLTVDDLVSSLWIRAYSCYLNAFSLSYALLPAMPHLCKISDLNSSEIKIVARLVLEKEMVKMQIRQTLISNNSSTAQLMPYLGLQNLCHP